MSAIPEGTMCDLGRYPIRTKPACPEPAVRVIIFTGADDRDGPQRVVGLLCARHADAAAVMSGFLGVKATT